MKKVKNHIYEHKKSYFWIFLAIFMVILFFLIMNQEPEEYHVHADFKVLIHGEDITNFSNNNYQSTGFNTLHPDVHLHDNNGNVIHHHAENINFSTFFNSLNMTLTDTCFLYNSSSYCTNETHKLEFYINDQQVQSLKSYVVEDLDRVLIVYDTIQTDTSKYLELVTDEACIQSALCPERGEPSEGSCITGETCIVDISQIK
ncbi:MAG: hypothetical protein VXZ40_04845 [Nanoarchaeota archaeon]|nr:hypothetical protein [Nanoarchaeota archaeon]